jgi:hypothetical protein
MKKSVIAGVASVPVVIIVAVIGFLSLGDKKDLATNASPVIASTSKDTNLPPTEVKTTPVPATATTNSSTAPTTSPTTAPATSPATSAPVVAPASSASVTKTAEIDFNVPDGYTEKLKVSITTDASGKITDANITLDPNNRESQKYASRFESAYKTEVVGKPISGLKLSRIGGASLTTAAFNKSLSQLK